MQKTSRRPAYPIMLLCLVCASFWLWACEHPSVVAQGSGESGSSVASGSYLPLQPGLKWVLKSPAQQFKGQQVVLEVEKQEGAAYWVRFNNPWNSVAWKLEPTAGDQFELRAIEFGGSQVPMPDGTTYFRSNAGEPWKNAIGTLRIKERDKTVKGADGTTYRNVILIEETSPEGNKMAWGLAPGVGFVQFGEGGGAFVLDRTASTLPGGGAVAPPAAPVPAPPGATPPSTQPVGPVHTVFGISDNPTAAALSKPLDQMTPADLQAVAQSTRELNEQGRAIGIAGQYVSARWDELLKEQGQAFDFKEVDDKVGRAIALDQTLELFTLRFPDTNNKPAPKGLEKLKFDDPALLAELDRLLPELIQRLKKNNVKRFAMGNEIDSYFKGNKKEVPAYVTLVRHVKQRVKQLAPGVEFGSTVTLDGVMNDDVFELLRPVLAEGSFFSVTYYPLK
jgi:hypothetical protein